jgi:signal transduction histidine kinase
MRMRVFDWPLVVKVPAATAALIFLVAVGTSQFAMMAWFAEEDRRLEQLGAVYMDGLAAVVLPYVRAGDAERASGALVRAFTFQEGIRERSASVHLPNGELLASGPAGVPPPRPVRVPFQLDEEAGVVRLSRQLLDDGRVFGVVRAELDISPSLERRRVVQASVVAFDVALSAAAALLGLLAIRAMLGPSRELMEKLRRVEAGSLEPIPDERLPPPETEFGRLLRAYNTVVRALDERERLTAELAERETLATLGRLSAALAHEVRNPLGGLLTAADTLRRYGADPQVREESIDLIERGLRSIGTVIDAALETWRGDARPLAPEDLDDVRRLVEPELRKRSVSLDWRAEAPGDVAAGAGEVRQILINLLLNAAAASPPGGTVALAARRAEDGYVLTVADEGPGLPDDVRATLLRGAAPTGRGLGVWMVMRLVRNLGASVAVDGAPGRGTVVTLRLPGRVPAEAADA